MQTWSKDTWGGFMFSNILTNFHLEKLIWIFKTNLKKIFLFTLIGAVIGGAVALCVDENTYEAEISFYVYSNPDYASESSVNISASEVTSASKLLSSYMQILSSNTFLNKIIEEAGLQDELDKEDLREIISAEAVSNTAVFIVTVADTDPQRAMEIANTIGEVAPDEIISIVKSGGIEVLDYAELPDEAQHSISIPKYICKGCILGFAVGFVVFMFIGLLNTTIRRKYEIEALFNIPIIGDVPYKTPISNNKKEDLFLSSKSEFSWKEAYSNIRISVLFAKKEGKCPIFAVTSADCGEGKTISSMNISSSYAQLGKKVLLIDADFRNSGMAKTLGKKDPDDGLSRYLSGATDKLEIFNLDENLDVILSGELPLNSSELLSSDRWFDLLKEYQTKYDAIFVDLPALAIVSDALTLARMATAYILVVRENKTKFDRFEMIVRKLEAVDANICGIVYNCISTKSVDYRYRNYGTEYDSRYTEKNK